VDIGGVVLAVAVQAHDPPVAVLQGELHARLDGAADAQVVGMADHVGPCPVGGRGRAVFGAVVDHQDLAAGELGPDGVHDGDHVLGLVESRDDEQYL